MKRKETLKRRKKMLKKLKKKKKAGNVRGMSRNSSCGTNGITTDRQTEIYKTE